MADLRQRHERKREADYLGFVAALPCVACLVHGRHKIGVHVAHLRGGSLEHGKRPTGMGEKPDDRWSTPLCPHHHLNGNKQSQHYYPGGEEAFWHDLGIDPFELCVALQEVFDDRQHAAYPDTRPTFGRIIVARFAGAGREELRRRA